MSPWKLLSLALLVAAPVSAQPPIVGDLIVDHSWARATPPAAPVAAGYVTILNRGTAPDRLIAVKSPVAERIEIHQSSMVDGVGRMRPVDGLSIAPGETVVLKPGGIHLMFSSLAGPFRRAARFPATFVFEKAGAVSVEFTNEAVGASVPVHSGNGTTRQ